MKRSIIALIICLLWTSVCHTNAQTDEQVAAFTLYGLGVGAALVEKGVQASRTKKSTQQIEQMRRSGDPSVDCYYVDSDGRLCIHEQDCYLPNGQIIKNMLCTECIKWQQRMRAEQEAERAREQLIQSQVWIDLGLPSGTLWSDQNVAGNFYTYEQAVSRFGNNLPTREQITELLDFCRWTWTGSGYMIQGPTGATIILPAVGECSCSRSESGVGSEGCYWSSTPYGSDRAFRLNFGEMKMGVKGGDRPSCYGQAVRLVRR